MANIGYIQVNRYCNNNCHFCSNPSNEKDISYERGIELINEFILKKYEGVIFTGGEPTLSKDLPKWIEYAKSKSINSRVISNGSITSDFDFAKKLKDAGLKLIHFSIYSHIEKIHDFLTGNPGSYQNVIKSIQNMTKLGVEVQINTVINHYNEDHLDKIVMFLNKQFPNIYHFVWNNLDPLMMQQTKIALTTLPNFDAFEISLKKAMDFLTSKRKTFRAERVPLCFMRGYEFVSTETRKIVKNEERLVYFLDSREVINDKGLDFIHDKKPECTECDLNPICGGVYESEKFYSYVKVKPQKLSKTEKESIINIINSN
ncbi:MAG: radical SAM protein [Candidatus Gracilibacteria bacterium]|nr:radical SAM protein [Candidatus Gracilibacteria bacterium]MDD2908591.1 radical SAM protein [Candidatus Gracilibacteria bacterium]